MGKTRAEQMREASRRYYRRHRNEIVARRAKRAMLADLEAVKEAARACGDLEGDHAAQAGIKQKYSPREVERAKRIVASAYSWVRENQSAWKFMKDRAASEVAAHRRFSASGLIHEARQVDFVDSAGNQTRIDNSIAPVIARALELEVPGTAELIERRATPIDEAFSEIWR